MRTDVPAAAAPAPPAPKPRPGALGQRWTLELPFTAPLSLNHRMNWAVKAKATKPWREAACVLAKAANIPACNRVSIELFYTPRDARIRDPLNLVASLKPIEDGIVDAGVLPDDNPLHHESAMPKITPKGPPRPGGNRLWVVVTRIG